MKTRIHAFIQAHHGLLMGSLWFSAGLLVVTMIAVPWLVARLPADYFTHPRRRPETRRRPLLRVPLLIMKNAAGLLLVVAGLLMFIGPGQGSLAMLAGVLMMDIPGKYRFECWLVGLKPVWLALGWIRRRTGRPPLAPPPTRGGER